MTTEQAYAEVERLYPPSLAFGSVAGGGGGFRHHPPTINPLRPFAAQ